MQIFHNSGLNHKTSRNTKGAILLLLMILAPLTAVGAMPFVNAASVPPALTVQPANIVAGINTKFTLNGGNFIAGSIIYYEITTVAPPTWSGTGTQWIQLPASIATLTSQTFSYTFPTAGTYYLLLSDSPTGATGSITTPAITVVAAANAPSYTLATTSGQVLDTVTISATFPVADTGDSIIVYFDSIPSATSAVVAPAVFTAGVSTYTFQVPHLTGGAHTIYFYDITHDITATYGTNNYATFTVLPKLTVVPPSVALGTTTGIVVSGTGFKAGGTFAASSTTIPVSNIVVGGVLAITHAAAAVSTVGDLPATALTLASGLNTLGPQVISMTYDQTALGSESFANALFVSSPSLSALSVTLSATSGTVGSALTVTYANFPAVTAPTISMNGVTFVGAATDANGFGTFALPAGVPALPGATYLVIVSAVDPATGAAEVASASFTVTAKVSINAGVGGPAIDNRYVPSGLPIQVLGTGLAPLTKYTVTDSGSGSAKAVTPTGGSSLTTDAAGTLSVTYNSNIGATVATSTSITVSVTGTGITSASATYFAVGTVTVTLPASTQPNTAVTGILLSGLIPATATMYSGSYTNLYNLYATTGAAPGSLLTLSYTNTFGGVSTTLAGGFDASIAALPSLSFGAAPATVLGAGIYAINVVRMDAAPTAALASQIIVVSVPALTTGSISLVKVTAGALTTVTGGAVGDSVTLYARNFGASEIGVTAFMMTTLGAQTIGAVPIDVNGAGKLVFTVPATSVGSYDIFVTRTTATAAAVIPIAFAVTSAISVSPTNNVALGATITVSAKGLNPNSVYEVVLGGTIVGTTITGATILTGSVFTADNTGASPTLTLTLPTAFATGTQNVAIIIASTYLPGLTPPATSAATVAVSRTITVSAAPVFTAASLSVSTASSGQTVSFAYNTGSTTLIQPIYVTVLANGSALQTAPAAYNAATGVLSGSFNMPNAPAGTVFQIQLQYQDTQNVNIYSSTHDTFTTAAATSVTLTQTSANYLANSELVVSNGAQLVRTTDYSVSVAAANPVITFVAPQTGPVAVWYTYAASATTRLNPVLTPAAGTTAVSITIAATSTSSGVLTTTDLAAIQNLIFNNATAPLTTILSGMNVTLVSVNDNVATLNTSLGTVTANINSLNASIVSLNGLVVTLNTTVGPLTTTLNAIGANITSIKGSVATITTTLGTVTASLTGINSAVSGVSSSIGTLTGTVSTIASGVVSIQTTLGTVQTSLASIDAVVGYIANDTLTINTSLGTMQVTLAQLGANITSNGNGIVAIQTTLGTISGTVTKIDGNVATIQTSLGTLQTDVTAIKGDVTSTKTNTESLSPLVIVAIVLALIAAIAAIASIVLMRRKIAG